MRDVSLVPERGVLERRHHRRTYDTREPAQVLAEHGVSLVRHRARALLPFRETFLRLTDLRPLPVTHVGREAFDAGGDESERRKERGVPVARDHLRGHGFRTEPE